MSKHEPELTEGRRKATIALVEGFASNAVRCLVSASTPEVRPQ
ncbi:hypothetical protein [Nonomuraea jabiensis]